MSKSLKIAPKDAYGTRDKDMEKEVSKDVFNGMDKIEEGMQFRANTDDGQRVFTSQELNALVTQGATGALVLVRVQRDEQQLDFYLPSGPIGIRLAPSRELP